jgi:hypothetical protein
MRARRVYCASGGSETPKQTIHQAFAWEGKAAQALLPAHVSGVRRLLKSLLLAD